MMDVDNRLNIHRNGFNHSSNLHFDKIDTDNSINKEVVYQKLTIFETP